MKISILSLMSVVDNCEKPNTKSLWPKKRQPNRAKNRNIIFMERVTQLNIHENQFVYGFWFLLNLFCFALIKSLVDFQFMGDQKNETSELYIEVNDETKNKRIMFLVRQLFRTQSAVYSMQLCATFSSFFFYSENVGCFGLSKRTKRIIHSPLSRYILL